MEREIVITLRQIVFTHQAHPGKMMLPEAALNEPGLVGGLLNRETRPSSVLSY